jgi:hypothetical protein
MVSHPLLCTHVSRQYVLNNDRRTLPQRQVHRPSLSQETVTALLDIPSQLANTTPFSHYLTTAPSKTEGGKGPAIYVNSKTPTINPAAHKIFFEVAHIHPQDYSLHVYLSPRDARLVIMKGWGLRFPVEWLAPSGWIMVYAPRSEEEVHLVRNIVEAACCFAVGRDLRGDAGAVP